MGAQTFIVENSSAQVARFNGGHNSFVSIYEEGAYRGYFGSFAGNSADVDFGTGSANSFGNLHLTIQAIPRFTIENTGEVGIGTTIPEDKLHIDNGNILLSNSSLGIRLNAADSPLITRGFDSFTSGKYNGIGRWGVFMEPHTLTFGMPNIAGKRFEFARYNSDSTLEPVVSIDRRGKVSRPTTNSANLLPICMGYVTAGGSVNGGTGNFTVNKNIASGLTEITISDETYSNEGFVTLVTNVKTDASKQFSMTEASSGNLLVWQYTDGGTVSNQDFHFVVYKMN